MVVSFLCSQFYACCVCLTVEATALPIQKAKKRPENDNDNTMLETIHYQKRQFIMLLHVQKGSLCKKTPGSSKK